MNKKPHKAESTQTECAELGKADAAALSAFVRDVLNGKRKKRTDPQAKTFTVRLKLDLTEQIKLGVMCERANMPAGEYLGDHLRCALYRLFDKMTDEDRNAYLARLDKAVEAMKAGKAVSEVQP